MRFSVFALTAITQSLLAFADESTFRVRFNVIIDAKNAPEKVDSFTIKIHPAWSPIGAARFKELVDAKFYDDTRFFRVIPGFMAQFGLSGDPAVSAQWRPKTILDDNSPNQGNKRGRITFAKTGAPNSRTTQLFINYADNSNLDGMGFTPFGEIEGEGMKTMTEVYPIQEKPNQGAVQSQGNTYLDSKFPECSQIKSVEVLGEEEL